MNNKLYRSNCFQEVDLPMKGFKIVESLQDLYVGKTIYWKYNNKIVTKGLVTNEESGYISDFNSLIKRGVLYIKEQETPKEISEIAEEQFEVKEEPPKKEPQQLTLF